MISFAQNDNGGGKLWVSAQGGILFSNVYPDSRCYSHYNREHGEYVLCANETNPLQPYVQLAPGNRFKAGVKLGIGLRYCFNERYSLILSGSLGLAEAENTDWVGITLRTHKNNSVGLTLLHSAVLVAWLCRHNQL